MFAGLLLIAVTPMAFAECITVPLDVRHADVVATGRYAGERTFVVESILRTQGARPLQLVDPEEWRVRECSPPRPVEGRLYLVTLYPTGAVGYREYERTTSERKLIRRLHAVNTSTILGVLRRYTKGELSRGAAGEWLRTAVVETPREGSFAQELLDTSEDLIDSIEVAEPCNKDVTGMLRTVKLPAALRAIEKAVPPVDTEDEFVRLKTASVKDPALLESAKDDASVVWDDSFVEIDLALRPLIDWARGLPWCDPKKYGWPR